MSEPSGNPQSWRAGLSLLSERDFARLFTARMISAFGGSMAFIALPFGVLELVGSDNPGPVGYVVACASAAQIGFQLLGGAFADRGSRQWMMVRADILATAAQVTMAALLLTGTATVPLMMGTSAVMGIAFALHFPAGVGLTPLVVRRDQLLPANALLGMANSMAGGMGAAMGGIVAANFGAGWAIGIDALTFAISGALVSTLRPREQARNEVKTFLRDILEGWREFTSHRWLWAMVLQFSLLLMGFQATYAVIGPIVAERVLGGAVAWGYIGGSFGVGLLTGGLVAIRVHIARPMLAGALLCFGMALLPALLIVPAPLGWIMAGAFMGGLGMEIFAVVWNTALHTRVAPEALSRVSSYDVVGSMLLAPVGEALAGPLVAAIGTASTLQVATLLVVVPTLLVLTIPDVRNLRAVRLE